MKKKRSIFLSLSLRLHSTHTHSERERPRGSSARDSRGERQSIFILFFLNDWLAVQSSFFG